MAAPGALYLALDLAATPILASAMRRQPLPDDMLLLIKTAAGDPESCRQAARLTGRQPDVIREAAILYAQQVLLAPDADSYRVLGVPVHASHERVREHMRWMMKWAHPDRGSNDWESAFAERVLGAWQALKTADRRREYDRVIGPQQRALPGRRTGRSRGATGVARRIPRIAGPPLRTGARRRRMRNRWVVVGVAIAVALAAFLVPDWGLRMQQLPTVGAKPWVDGSAASQPRGSGVGP